MNCSGGGRFIFHTIFLISTGITLFILYSDINNGTAHVYMIIYALCLIIFMIYAFSMIMIRLWKLDRADLLARIQMFFLYFILFNIVHLSISYFLDSISTNLINSLFIAFGLALGLTCFDLLFKKA